MTRPLPSAPDEPAPVRTPLRSAWGRVVYWMPVWIPLAVLAQLGLLGHKPALREDARLRAAESRLERRLEGLHEEREELEQDLAAFEDPIFLERLRRLRER